MEMNQKTVIAVALQAVEEGKIWAKCPKCRIVLSIKELKKKKCDVCGKISFTGKEHITFHPKTDMC